MIRSVKIFVTIVMIVTTCLFCFVNVSAQSNDEYDMLRLRWEEYLTGGENYDVNDPVIKAQIDYITNTAEEYRASMNKEKDRTYLWEDLSTTTKSAHVTSSYSRVSSMALAYATKGSPLYGDKAFLEEIKDALEWLYDNRYNPKTNVYDNWWDWEIGTPRQLNNILVLIYDDLSDEQIKKYVEPIKINIDNPMYCNFSNSISTGANRVWLCNALSVSGVLVKDSQLIETASKAFDAVFPYVKGGDGFYKDGSFIQHSVYSYTGGYGMSLLSDTATAMYLLENSSWAIKAEDKDNFFNWVYDSFEPLTYNGAFLDMVCGREISRYSASPQNKAKTLINALIMMSEYAPSEHKAAYSGMIKNWITKNSYTNYYNGTSIFLIERARNIVENAEDRQAWTGTKMFSAMDRAVVQRENFALGIAMHSSKRTASYESINNENLKGWYTAAGAVYLYDNDEKQYADNYWGSVDMYRLAGVTAPYKQSQSAGSFNDDHAGGAVLDGYFGAIAFRYIPGTGNLDAKKSYFVFDDEVVMTGIVNVPDDALETNTAVIETTIENRKISPDSKLVINSEEQKLTDEEVKRVENVEWMHLTGDGGSEIGYYMTSPVALNVLKNTRKIDWGSVNKNTVYPKELDSMTNTYMTVTEEHGTKDDIYSYVLLPGKSAEQTKEYSQNPDVEVIEINNKVHMVKENKTGVTAANFWSDEETKAGLVTCDAKASVIVKEDGDYVTVAACDPTQKNTGVIYIELDMMAEEIVSKDDNVKVFSLSPKVTFSVLAEDLAGETSCIKFVKKKQESKATRCEFVKMLVDGLNLNDSKAKSYFSDVNSLDVNYPYVSSALEKGIITGDATDVFAPYRLITRQEAAVMISRLNLDVIVTEEYIIFGDDNLVCDWAKNAVQFAVKIGVIDKDADGNINPDGFITLNEAQKMIDSIKAVKGGDVNE